MTYILERKLQPKKSSKSSGRCGQARPKTTTRKKPSRRGIVKRCERRVIRHKRVEPMEQLPPEYIVRSKKQRSRIPELHYCISVSADELYAYAVKHSLIPDLAFANAGRRKYCGMVKATNELARLSGAILFLQAPLWSAEESWLVARYSNYNWSYHMNVLNGPPDEEAFSLVRRELGTTSTPKWYKIIT
ncbi:hypothetical protein EWM64_g10825 [Hericium alpestre]|uniref:Uncharacterized protein n=1 Tax=Hericium alpestre TaxID=135208 RepID=A0A4Y9ZGN4_9AGAM|nr:hypothetical protein EWM64_g10825 [Hericium alpestre]